MNIFSLHIFLPFCTHTVLTLTNNSSTSVEPPIPTQIGTNAHWTEWSAWSNCTPPGCGFSTRRRHRICRNAKIGDICKGIAQQSVECGTGEPCKSIGPNILHHIMHNTHFKHKRTMANGRIGAIGREIVTGQPALEWTNQRKQPKIWMDPERGMEMLQMGKL